MPTGRGQSGPPRSEGWTNSFPAQGSFTHYGMRNGLPTNTALGVLEDEGGYLWTSTPSDGLGSSDPRSATCINYHTADGLLKRINSTTLAGRRQSQQRRDVAGSYTGLIIAFFPETKVIDS